MTSWPGSPCAAARTSDLNPAMVRVDVREFNALIGRPDAASLERAAGLYRDDFLAGFTLRGCPDFRSEPCHGPGRRPRVQRPDRPAGRRVARAGGRVVPG